MATEKVDEATASQLQAATPKRLTRRQLIIRRFFRNKSAVFGLILFAVIVIVALFGNSFNQWQYTSIDPGQYLKAPDATHWFGTNKQGRDVFAMTVEGLRKSIIIGLAVAFIQTSIAAIVGSTAAYFGGWVDKVETWFIDLLLVIPSFLIIAIISQRLSGETSSTLMFIVLLAAFGWMMTARVVRSLTMSLKGLDYVTAAKYMSVPSWTIIMRHILPNISSLLIIDFTLGVVSAVLSETSLSYFGFGVKEPQVSLGSLIAAGQPSALTYSWLFVPPALVLVALLASINFIGDGLRDALDPSSQSGGKA
ncbi:MAG: ABC transporter permease [Ancrocorticia sp.]|jgi:peptide/nickel transport system permease protein|nr:ABC transporter permease [Ancrocorticia sp.]MCI1933233.1 ABC transporter permease [Ancrocorticia sp.]MCI1963885.1 ABC transporter permease [Ancrocorticia sp.]MCI2001568.1 ABC transporter permease [Ancrocorticia sp.]MCI2013422.1 ABC transporter permease [Ancrocorticia sp.]